VVVSFIGGGNQTLSHNVASSTRGFELTTLLVIDTECTCSCKSTTVP